MNDRVDWTRHANRAVRAPRDPVWTADGMILQAWAPAAAPTGAVPR